MWCLLLTGTCCCGPCEARITTGAKVVFSINLISASVGLILALVFSNTSVALQLGMLTETSVADYCCNLP
jgi:hypothetical protein